MNDVLIIGGGPAGAAAACLLAREGHSVKVLEKERFPRFHIGESLLPMDLPIFERLGVQPDADAFLLKRGADFADEATGERCRYLFADGLPGTPEHAYQVERSSFDAQLLGLARDAGAEVLEGERVSDFDVQEGEVRVKSTGGEHRARYLVDATGQDALLARRRRTLTRVDGFGIAAAFTHFTELGDAAVASLEETGNITILMRDDGWTWVIPLTRRRLSVGVVSADKGVSEGVLDDAIASSPMLRELTAGAARAGTHVVGNFSYLNDESHGARFACIGDAAGFLDPVFSSGVTLALMYAEGLADLLSPALRAGSEADPLLLSPLAEKMNHAYEVFGSLIHSFYRTGLVKNLFFYDEPDSQIRAGLISILAGDVFRDDNLFKGMLLRSRRRRRRLRGPDG